MAELHSWFGFRASTVPLPGEHTIYIVVLEWSGTGAFVNFLLHGKLHMKSTHLTLCVIAIMVAAIPIACMSVAVAQTEPLNCDEWNTTEFFEVATADDVMACLAMGADVHARSDDGHTPLHNAARDNSNPLIVERLLAAGAEVDTRDDIGLTPLLLAALTNESVAVIQTVSGLPTPPSFR